MIERAVDEITIDIAELAVEFWKILQNYERVVDSAPEQQKPGLVAQAKYGSRRMINILERSGIRLETFEGVPFTSNLPVSAVNPDDFFDAVPIVGQTLEPAVIVGTEVIRTGRVFLRADQT